MDISNETFRVGVKCIQMYLWARRGGGFIKTEKFEEAEIYGI